MANEHFTEYLREELEQRKQKNARYSERAFAKALGLSAGFLSLVMQKKKKLSLERAKRIAMKVAWPSPKTYRFLELVRQQPSLKVKPPDKIFSILFSAREKCFAGKGLITHLESDLEIPLEVTTKLSSLTEEGRISRKMLTRYSFATGHSYELDLELRDTNGGTFVIYSKTHEVGKGFFVDKVCHADLDFSHPQLGPFRASVSYVFRVNQIETVGRNYSMNTTFQHTVEAIRAKKGK